MANKKTQRRPKARSRPTPRRAQPTAPGAVAVQSPGAESGTAEPIPPRMPAATVRRPQTARRAPVTAINYAYLRHDLKTLAVLATSMVVLVIIAFIFIH